jgi:glycosyltransferase involved in cell wall biosynthesis
MESQLNPHPKVAVVVPCRNEVNYIVDCVDSILNQNYPDHLVSVLICDGMSTDGTRELIGEKFASNSRVQVIDNVRGTTPFALNLGIDKGKADVSIIFGAHAIMEADYIQRCVEVLLKDSSVGCVGGVIKNINENQVSEYVSQCMSSSFGVGNAHFRTGDHSGYVDTVAFGAYRAEVFEQLGYFDEALTRNQDDEFNFRLTQAGWKIYLDANITSKYFVRGSYHKLAKQYYQYGYWKVYVNKMHGTITTWRQLIPFFFVSYLLGSLIGLGLMPTYYLCWFAPLLLYVLLAIGAACKFGFSFQGIINRVFIYLILHLAYGWGYLVGIAKIVIMGKGAGSHGVSSSR